MAVHRQVRARGGRKKVSGRYPATGRALRCPREISLHGDGCVDAPGLVASPRIPWAGTSPLFRVDCSKPGVAETRPALPFLFAPGIEYEPCAIRLAGARFTAVT